MLLLKPGNRRTLRQRGVVTVEFAALLPIFVLFLVGIVEFGHLWYLKHVLTNASREGARYAVILKNRTLIDDTTMENLVRGNLTPGFWTQYGVEVQVQRPDPLDTGQPLTVRVRATQNASLVLGPLLAKMGYEGFEGALAGMSGQTTMILE